MHEGSGGERNLVFGGAESRRGHGRINEENILQPEATMPVRERTMASVPGLNSICAHRRIFGWWIPSPRVCKANVTSSLIKESIVAELSGRIKADQGDSAIQESHD
jgi:hypothetical protein